MKEQTTNRKSSMLFSALVGSAVGAGIALLLAPKKGKEMRKDLKQFAAHTRDQFAEVIDEGKALYKERTKALPRSVNEVKKTYVHQKEKILRHAA